jgi:hypothetical protein
MESNRENKRLHESKISTGPYCSRRIEIDVATSAAAIPDQVPSPEALAPTLPFQAS